MNWFTCILHAWQAYSAHPSKEMAPGAAAMGFAQSGWGLQGVQAGFEGGAMQTRTRPAWGLVLAHLHSQIEG